MQINKTLASGLIFSILTVISSSLSAQNPTIYLDDFNIEEPQIDAPEDLSGQNIFTNIFFIEKEVYEGGFKERKLTIYNECLLQKLKSEEIYFNTNHTFKYDLPGFYKNKNLKAAYSVSSEAGKKEDTKPNIFFVKDIILNEEGELESLLLSKAGEKTDDIFFSVRDFITESKVKIGTLADLGLINMSYLHQLEQKHKGKSYHLAFHTGQNIAIPDNTDLPQTIRNRTINDQKKLAQSGDLSSILVFGGLASRNASWALAGLLLDIGMRNSFESQQRKMLEFREKQRQLLYNFDIVNSTFLSPSDFGPDVTWTFEDIKVLEDSGSPVLILKNGKGQKILVLEELEDLYLTDAQAAEIKGEIGDENYRQLYNMVTNEGYALPMVRFAIGYQNYMAMASEIDKTYEEAYAFGKEWYYFKKGLLTKKEWKNYRAELEVFDQQSITTEEQ